MSKVKILQKLSNIHTAHYPLMWIIPVRDDRKYSCSEVIEDYSLGVEAVVEFKINSFELWLRN